MHIAPSRARPPHRNRIVFAILWLAGLLLPGLLAGTGPGRGAAAPGANLAAITASAGMHADTPGHHASHGIAAPLPDTRTCLPCCGACECEDPCLPLPVLAAQPETGRPARLPPGPSIASSRPPRHRGRGPPAA